MMLAGFSIARLPRIEFGAGKIAALPAPFFLALDDYHFAVRGMHAASGRLRR